MERIEIENLILDVPTSFKDLPFGRFEDMLKHVSEGAAGLVEKIEILCNIPFGTLLPYPTELFDLLVDKTAFAFKDDDTSINPSVRLDGVLHVANVEEKITLGEWVDVEEAEKAGRPSDILAILCRPAGDRYDPAKADPQKFRDAPASDVLPLLRFFLHLKKELEKLSLASTELKQAAGQLPRNIWSLQGHGAGTKLSQIWRATTYYFLAKSLKRRLLKL